MNRIIYFTPLASLPLMALAQQNSDESMKTDNPYVAAVLIFIVVLAVAVALVSYFRLRTRGRVTAGIVFGVLDWLITGADLPLRRRERVCQPLPSPPSLPLSSSSSSSATARSWRPFSAAMTRNASNDPKRTDPRGARVMDERPDPCAETEIPRKSI